MTWASVITAILNFLSKIAPVTMGVILGKKMEQGKQTEERLKNVEEIARNYADMPVTPDDAATKLLERAEAKRRAQRNKTDNERRD